MALAGSNYKMTIIKGKDVYLYHDYSFNVINRIVLCSYSMILEYKTGGRGGGSERASN